MQIIDFSSEQQQVIQDLQISDYGTFVFAKRWRQRDGLTPNSGKITLGCGFFNGKPEQHALVVNAANDWLDGRLGQLIDFRFDVPVSDAHIRIQLGGNRNNSYVGRDNLRIPKEEPTMRLANFNRPSTVKHEFGHALGLRHEHRFPGAISFREDVVVEEMRRRHGWSQAQTYRNILTPLDSSAKCIGDPDLNETSIMMYTIPSRWTQDGASYQRAGIITERDRRCLIGVYSA
ncbi:hypothetical protein [uncultured Tateyamaria sp.]|uniref:hypothetical protein n=1 Tax=uncultured Tateyamaria sp. TaxID=455651 RepID=UPI002612DF97|nr:hypothetical protein [uncultured Tateyamaria sp.]